MKRRILLGCATIVGCVVFSATAGGDDPVNTVWNAQKARAKAVMPVNAARVKADWAAAMNINYLVSLKRTQWLKAKRLAE